MGGSDRWLKVVLSVCVLAMGIVIPASAAEAPTRRIASTSGVPHADVANYRASPYWRPGMPKGINGPWRTYLDTVVEQITEGADLVLHQGDMVEGRWGIDVDDRGVFGPVRTYRQKVDAVGLAGDVIYPQMKAFWSGHDVLWGMGDHEVGDLSSSGLVRPTDFRYRAHAAWNAAWRRTFGPLRHANRRGDLGIVTLDPIVRWDDGLRARIPRVDLAWLEERVASWRADGVRWVIVQSEIPALGPNRATSTSELVLENGDRVWRTLRALDVDLLLSAEFHADTTYTDDGHTPVQVVHGGRHARASWLVVDQYGEDRLELTLMESAGELTGAGEIWAPSGRGVNNEPVAGIPHVTGTMTILADGSLSNRSGYLSEGPGLTEALTEAGWPVAALVGLIGIPSATGLHVFRRRRRQRSA